MPLTVVQLPQVFRVLMAIEDVTQGHGHPLRWEETVWLPPQVVIHRAEPKALHISARINNQYIAHIRQSLARIDTPKGAAMHSCMAEKD